MNNISIMKKITFPFSRMWIFLMEENDLQESSKYEEWMPSL